MGPKSSSTFVPRGGWSRSQKVNNDVVFIKYLNLETTYTKLFSSQQATFSFWEQEYLDDNLAELYIRCTVRSSYFLKVRGQFHMTQLRPLCEVTRFRHSTISLEGRMLCHKSETAEI